MFQSLTLFVAPQSHSSAVPVQATLSGRKTLPPVARQRGWFLRLLSDGSALWSRHRQPLRLVLNVLANALGLAALLAASGLMLYFLQALIQASTQV